MSAPAIGRRPRWAPASARVDWSHPLAVGLRLYTIVPHLTDLVNGYPGTSISATRGTSAYGVAVDYGASSGVSFGARPLVGGGSPWSAFAVGRMPTSLSGGKTIVSKRDLFGGPFDELCFGLSGATLYVAKSNSATTVTGADVTAGAHQMVGVTCSASTVTAYIDGRVAGTPQAADRRTNTAAGDTIGIGRNIVEANESFNGGSLTTVAVWNRVLSDSDMAALHADPFCLLRY